MAQTLGLLEGGEAREDGLFLLQLPALLPAAGPPPGPPDKARPGARRDDAQPPPGALSLRDLPSGKVRGARYQLHPRILGRPGYWQKPACATCLCRGMRRWVPGAPACALCQEHFAAGMCIVLALGALPGAHAWLSMLCKGACAAGAGQPALLENAVPCSACGAVTCASRL